MSRDPRQIYKLHIDPPPPGVCRAGRFCLLVSLLYEIVVSIGVYGLMWYLGISKIKLIF